MHLFWNRSIPNASSLWSIVCQFVRIGFSFSPRLRSISRFHSSLLVLCLFAAATNFSLGMHFLFFIRCSAFASLAWTWHPFHGDKERKAKIRSCNFVRSFSSFPFFSFLVCVFRFSRETVSSICRLLFPFTPSIFEILHCPCCLLTSSYTTAWFSFPSRSLLVRFSLTNSPLTVLFIPLFTLISPLFPRVIVLFSFSNIPLLLSFDSNIYRYRRTYLSIESRSVLFLSFHAFLFSYSSF